MDILKYKIKQLLSANHSENVKVGGFDAIRELMEYQNSLMNECERLARKQKSLLGRIIKFSMADSFAYYIITKVNKKTVRLEWINYCDGWMDSRIGEGGLIDIEYVENEVRHQDRLHQLFS